MLEIKYLCIELDMMKLLPILDVLLAPFVYLSAYFLKRVRRLKIKRLPCCKKALFKAGAYPLLDHYYEPQFNHGTDTKSLQADRLLPGIDWNINGQLAFLEKLTYASELNNIPDKKMDEHTFYFGNSAFESGDAEYWYQIIRVLKPKKIIEVGSGNSTLLARMAIAKNQQENSDYICKHICIEPYEQPWLESLNIEIIREKVEAIEIEFFAQLEENDILFIDSSHMIRPQGDVLFEILQLLPSLNKGVVVHVHDIFSPKNYPWQWLQDDIRFWNEQYLLEAFLTHNSSWQIIGALNYLHHNHYESLKNVAPYLEKDREPGSFYIKKL